MADSMPLSNGPESVKTKRAPKPKPVNPIEAAINSWLKTLPFELLETMNPTSEVLISQAPKRWVAYPPMILLPSGSFDSEWKKILHTEKYSRYRSELWKLVLDTIGLREGKGLFTHLAINSGIPLHKSTENDDDSENILRTPSGLVMLHGDFGPPLSPDTQPSPQDFKDAFWVSTKQNGTTQIWAPRYTMFSRGNVKEKARLLDFHQQGTIASRSLKDAELRKCEAVDLFAGIGYFVFSYVKMGMGRVLGWELNPWSVEGLRRGAVANNWSVKVIHPGQDHALGDENIVVFLEDNRNALRRLEQLQRVEMGGVKHVNCGLLPTSALVWEMALCILNGEGWLHLHENVGLDDVPKRKLEIEELFKSWLQKLGSDSVGEVQVEHVEFVKTFAPGVWHSVFDVYTSRRQLLA